MQDAFLRLWERWERVSAMESLWASSAARP